MSLMYKSVQSLIKICAKRQTANDFFKDIKPYLLLINYNKKWQRSIIR